MKNVPTAQVVATVEASELPLVVGPKGKHAPDRTAKRHERGSMTLGGRRVAVGASRSAGR